MEFEVIADGLAFPEGPRWHDGALWFSDMHAPAVMRVVPGGRAETIVEVPEKPSGLGFLPDGTLLVASMHDRTVRRVENGRLHLHADLHHLATWHVNDMLVDDAGRAYVGTFGDDSIPPTPPRPSNLSLVHPDGRTEVAADGMEFANGMALIDDGRTLVVAETRANPPCLTAFDRDQHGHLSNRRILVQFAPGELPDGICADGDDHVWVASPFTGEVLRVSPAGDIVQRITSPQPPYACALGGEDGHTLFICASATWMEEEAVKNRTGQILATRVATGV